MNVRAIAILSLAAGLWAGGARADVEVVASIKPIHALVTAVMEGTGTPALVLEGASSPHTYAMRPSTARAIANADVVFWVGDQLETFMANALVTLAPDAKVAALIDTPGLTLLPLREGGAFDPHEHEAHEAHDDDDAHEDEHEHEAHEGEDEEHEEEHAHEGDAHGVNPHIWLDPANARAMVAHIAATLEDADPDNAATYAANAQRRIGELEALESEMTAMLAPVRGRSFVVFHDAYPYLEARFGVAAVGSITVSPEILPGAAQLGEIRERIEALGATCVFAEPQFAPKLIDVVVDGTQARTGVLDPLGAEIPAGRDQYDALMRANARALLSCLSPQS